MTIQEEFKVLLEQARFDNECSIIENKIHEAFYNDAITESEYDFLINKFEVIYEKKTRDEYRRRAFKKRYKFIPSKEDPDIGHITIDGQKFTVDMKKSSTVKFKDDEGNVALEIPRQNSYTIDDTGVPYIMIDKNLFKLKNRNRINAIIDHEIGHGKYHNFNNSNSDVTDKETAKGILVDLLQQQEEYNNLSENELMNMITSNPEIMQVINSYSDGSSSKIQLRKKALEIFKKYAKTGHTSKMEFEADRYSANKNSENDLRAGLRELYKNIRKDNIKVYKKKGTSAEELKKRMKELNKTIDIDYNTRSKVLSDKDIKTRFKDVYK